tara:strand:+ start:7474 stop:7869 length:396 start_codon:yes stop_codon:yes gene_type:complete
METKFLIGDWDFWGLLIGHSGWGIIGIALYFHLVYGKEIIKTNPIIMIKKYWPLMVYSFVITNLFAIVFIGFPGIEKVLIENIPFYSKYLANTGFVGIGALALRFVGGDIKNDLKTDAFIKKTGFDPNKEA